ncbi:MFS transporter [Pseudonocardia kujensis]|uniref:MFS transporter n=1 Tax=Pseudonocardia kujensis TaxID=1128675 RepID=UPI001E4A9257|nr:MFS transporter [Pseudonocardia kujensis]MCE0764180.1 MFS transporter [Pseudonocardia kujensis]
MTRVPTNADVADGTAPPSARRRTLMLTAVGNVFEWYDFTVYGFFAPAIAATFFPKQDSLAALLSTFVVFVVGFLARPLGGLIFGRLVDRKGRKAIMLFSMLLMATGSLLIALAPGYVTAGVLGTLIVVVGRLCQGLSAGGEQGSAGMFLVEWAGTGRRAFFGSFLNSAATTGVLLGALLGALLTTTLGTATVNAWAWRIPFFLGAALALVVFFLRRDVEESPVFEEIRAAHRSAEEAQAASSPANRLPNGAAFFVVLGFIALWTTTTFITLTYMPTFAFAIVGVNASGSLWATALGAGLTAALIPVGGWISDRVGRRPVIFFSGIGYLVLAVPLFTLVATTKEFWAVLLLEFVLAFFSAPILGMGVALIVEMFHGRNHGFLVTVTMAVGVTLFGGFGPYICTWLISMTGQPISASYWVVAVSVLTLVSALFIPRDLHTRPLSR